MFDRRRYFMQHALDLAKAAESKGEIPVAAVVVHEDIIIGQAYNRPIERCDPTAHAEILAMRAAGKYLKNYRLLDCTLYVTLEPCIMCAGAMVHARIKELIFGAYDPKAGAVTNAFELFDDASINHQIQWKGGVMQQECGALLKDFFAKRRSSK